MILAWHFCKVHRFAAVLRDGTTIVPAVMTHTGPLVLCKSGLHASERAIDALSYAPGPIVCRVECDGAIVRGDDKLVCTVRRVLWKAHSVRALKLWACDCAERALLREREHGREPDPRSWRGIEVQRAYIDGRATRDELKQAEADANAARDAAWDAARAAAGAAAWDAARAAQRKHLLKLVRAAFKKAKER